MYIQDKLNLGHIVRRQNHRCPKRYSRVFVLHIAIDSARGNRGRRASDRRRAVLLDGALLQIRRCSVALTCGVNHRATLYDSWGGDYATLDLCTSFGSIMSTARCFMSPPLSMSEDHYWQAQPLSKTFRTIHDKPGGAHLERVPCLYGTGCLPFVFSSTSFPPYSP